MSEPGADADDASTGGPTRSRAATQAAPGPARQISVAELLAANGRSVEAGSASRRRRRSEPSRPVPPAASAPPQAAAPEVDVPEVAAPVVAAPVVAAPEVAAPVVAAPGAAAPAAPAAAHPVTEPVTRPVAEPAAPADPPPAPRRAAAERPASRTPGVGAVPLGRVVLAVAAGALVWLATSFLWVRAPLLAAVVGVLVTAGLVVAVRRHGSGADLTTTLVAVVVGAVVTLGPGATTLVGS